MKMATSLEIGELYPPSECENCKQQLTGEIAVAGGKFFHSTCFTCSKCEEILENGYVGSLDRPLCAGCYVKSHVILCDGCHKAFPDNMCYELCGKRFHRECLKCSGCKEPFKDNRCYSIGANAYCLVCYCRFELKKDSKEVV